MKRLIAMLGFGLCVIVGAAQAQAPEAEALVRQTTEQVLSALEQNKERIKDDPLAVQALVGEIVLPHFDFELMSRLVLARGWREATPEQQKRFVSEFRQLLIRTYGTSLSHYSGQKVEYLPSQPDPDPKRATVRTLIRQAEGPPVPVTDQLRQTSSGWKAFEVVIEGVSLVQNYRTSFAAEIQQHGLDALIQRIHERNVRPGAA
jgi:phospholipid transport system substrate-binding protein